MAEKIKFTTRWLQSLGGERLEKFADSGMLGLQVWTRKNGPQFYFVMKSGGRQYNNAIGRFPEVSLEDAREEVLRRRGSLASFGKVDAPAHRSPTLGDAVRMFLERTDVRPATIQWARGSSRLLGGLMNRRISELERRDFEELKRRCADRPALCGEAIKLARGSINYLRRELDMPELPNRAAGVEIPRREPRKRFLDAAEAPALIAELRRMAGTGMHGIQAKALLMMAFTGQRKSNVLQMEYSEIENGIWTIPGAKSKNHRAMRVPLNAEALAILAELNPRGMPKSGYVFKGRGPHLKNVDRTLHAACRNCGISDFHAHDLRRTLASWMLMSGIDIAVVSKTLGHSSIAVTEQVYAHLLPEKISGATELAVRSMLEGRAGKR